MGSPKTSQRIKLDRKEVIRFIAEQERLTKTANHFGVDKKVLTSLLVEDGDATGEGSVEEVPLLEKTSKSSKSKKKSSPAPKKEEKAAKPAKPAKPAKSKKSKSKAKAKRVEEPKVEAEVVVTKEEKKPSKTADAPSPKKEKKKTTKTKGSASKEKKKKEVEAAPPKTEEEKPASPAPEPAASPAKPKASKEEKKPAAEPPAKEKESTNSEAEKTRKRGRRRQSSPRGRKALRYDPDDYVYQRLLIYTDGAARGNPGESGAGVVLKTPEGEEVGRFGKYLGRGTNNFAEYQALLLGLQHAEEFGAKDITILSDSDLLVRQLCGEYRVRASHLRVLFEEAQQLLTQFSKYQIKRIEREKNREADSMANRAIDEKL